VSEASARAGASRATHRATPHVSARRPDPGLLEQASTCQGNALAPGLLPTRGEELNAIPTAEHLKGSHGIGFTCGPPPHNRQPIGHVKVLLDRATTWVACQAGSALLPPFRPCRVGGARGDASGAIVTRRMQVRVLSPIHPGVARLAEQRSFKPRGASSTLAAWTIPMYLILSALAQW
jgi:hypothetical protein